MSKVNLTDDQRDEILRKLDERVRRIDTRVTIVGNAVGAPFNVNTKPHVMPNGTMTLPSRHTTLADILATIDGAEHATVPLMLDGAVIAVLTKM